MGPLSALPSPPPSITKIISATPKKRKLNHALLEHYDRMSIFTFPVIRNIDVIPCLGHATRVKALCMNQEETMVFSSSLDCHTLTLWDVAAAVHRGGRSSRKTENISLEEISAGGWVDEGPKQAGLFCGHRNSIVCMTINQQGTLLASSGRDGKCRLWDIATTKVLLKFSVKGLVVSLRFSSDSNYLFAGSQDQRGRIIDAQTGRVRVHVGEKCGILLCAVSDPLDRYIAAGSSDHHVRLWSWKTGKLLLTFARHKSLINSVSVVRGTAGRGANTNVPTTTTTTATLSAASMCGNNNDGNIVISCDYSTIYTWLAQTGDVLRAFSASRLRFPMGGGLEASPSSSAAPRWACACFCPGPFAGHYVIAGTSGRWVAVFDCDGKDEMIWLTMSSRITAFHDGGSMSTVVLGDANGNIYLVKMT